MGMISPKDARVKMEVLDKLFFTFQLDKLEVKVKYHDKI